MGQVRFGERLLVLLMESLAQALPGCAGVGLSVAGDRHGGRAAAGIGVAPELDAAQWAAGDGPLVEAATGDGSVICPDLGADPRWPGFRRPRAAGGLAAVAVPGGWSDDGPVVLSTYLAAPPDPADLAVLDRYEPLLATGLGVVEYCSDELVKADQMIEMMRRRQLIEQTKGVLMGAAGLDAEGAFELMVRISQRRNVKIRHLAAALLAQVRGETAAEVPEPARDVAAGLWRELRPGAPRSGHEDDARTHPAGMTRAGGPPA
jgi:hypothetical protein